MNSNRVYVEPNWNLINVLNKNLGMNVVYIDNRYFVYQEFLPAEEEKFLTHHKVTGRDVTKMMSKYATIISNSQTSIAEVLTNVEDSVLIDIEYSPNYEWIRYLAS